MQKFCICLIRTAADRDFSLMDAKARISKAGRQACIAEALQYMWPKAKYRRSRSVLRPRSHER